MKVSGKDSKEAMAVLKQVNVEMIEASSALKEKAAALVSEDVLEDAKAKITASGELLPILIYQSLACISLLISCVLHCREIWRAIGRCGACADNVRARS